MSNAWNARRLLQSHAADELRSQFQRVVGIANLQVLALSLLLIGIWRFTPIPIAFAGVAATLAGLHALNLALLLTSQRARSIPVQIALHTVFSVLLMTSLIHFLGSTDANITVVFYIVVMLNSQVLLSTAGYFVHANFAALAYGFLLLLEGTGRLETYPLISGGWSPPHWSLVMALANWVSLNLVAASSTSFGSVLERKTRDLARAKDRLEEHSRELERIVAMRTRELARANAELVEKASALERRQDELRGFVYTVTHDLKNPLSAILLIADLIQQREGKLLSEEGREDLARIERLAICTENMIRDLLGLFRITSAPETSTWVDLNGLVSHSLETLGPQITAKAIQVSVGSLPWVWGQPGKLTHVVDNLLANAVKYVGGAAGEIEVTANLENGATVLCVYDNGIGIDPVYHAGIFEIFGRVPEQEQLVDGLEAGGTGVGLAIVKRIVEAHHGSVSVESRPGHGSRFFVRLPRENGSGEAG